MQRVSEIAQGGLPYAIRNTEYAMPVEIELEDVVRLRKQHPCGGYEWRVVRLGADIGVKCTTCGRRVLLPRSEFERRLKTVISRAARPPTG